MFVYEEIFNKPYFLFFALFLYELHQCVWHQISYYSWMNYEASCTNYMYYLVYSFFIFQLPGQNIPRYRDKSVKPHEDTKTLVYMVIILHLNTTDACIRSSILFNWASLLRWCSNNTSQIIIFLIIIICLILNAHK